jgi:hypothetical protein
VGHFGKNLLSFLDTDVKRRFCNKNHAYHIAKCKEKGVPIYSAQAHKCQVEEAALLFFFPFSSRERISLIKGEQAQL